MNRILRFHAFVLIALVITFVSIHPVLADDPTPIATPAAEENNQVDVVTAPQGTSVEASEQTDESVSSDNSPASADTTSAAKGSVAVTSVRTADLNGNTKTVFNPGDSIRYYGSVQNDTGKTANATFIWSRSGPCGSATLWSGNLDTGTGTWLWNIDSSVPTNCPGKYSYKLSVTYNGKQSSKSTNFSIKTSVNTPPVANNQNVTTAQNSAKSIILTASDANNDSLTYSIVSTPAHGVLSGALPNLTYTPNTNFSGADSFTFKVNDGFVDSNIATVRIPVTATGQPPAAPSNLQATALDANRIQLKWTDNANNENGFAIYDGSIAVATVGANTTSYMVNGLVPNSYHCYHLYTFNNYGNSAWTDWGCTITLAVVKVQFSVATFTVQENGGAATITVVLSSAASQGVSVEYVTSNGTATTPADYTAASGTLTFDPGVTSRTFTVAIADDNLHEANETINLTLRNPSNATVGTLSNAILTIIDNDSIATCERLVGTGTNIRLAIVPAGFDDSKPQDVAKFNQLAANVADAFVHMQPYVSNLNKFSIWKANNYIGKNINVQSDVMWLNSTLINAAKVCNYNQILVIAHNSGWAGGAPGFYSVIGSGTPPSCNPATCTGTACPGTASCSWDESIKYTALHETGHTFAGLGHSCSVAGMQTLFSENGATGDAFLAATRPPNCGIQFSGNPNVACTEWKSSEFQRWVLPGDPIFGCYAGCDGQITWYRPWETSVNLMCRDDGLQHGFTPVDRRLLEVVLQRQNAVASVSTDGGELVVHTYSTESTAAGFNVVSAEQQNVAVFTFASGAFSGTTELLYTPLDLSSGNEVSITIPALYVERIFQLTGLWPKAASPSERQPASLLAGQHYTVTLTYDPTTLPESVGEHTLALYAWNEATKTWVAEPAIILDPDAHTLTASLDHFGVWAVLGGSTKQDKALYLPLINR